MSKPTTDRAEGALLAGGAWMVAMRWAIRGIGLISTIILARLLTPTDFGIVAMAWLVIGFLEVFTQAGVDLALIRNRGVDRDTYNSAWTLQIILHGGLAAALVLISPFAADFFDEPAVSLVIKILALGTLLEGCENIGVVAFRKDLDFYKEFRFNVYKKLAAFLFSVGLAILFRNYWALVAGTFAAKITSLFLSYGMHPYRPAFCLRKIGEIWAFSRWLVLQRVGRFLSLRVDEFVVGAVAGSAKMGSYHVASDIATLPTTEVVLPMARGLYPVYAQLQGDHNALVRAYGRSLGLVALFCLPAGFGIALIAEDLVLALLGDKWRFAIDLMRWLAIFGAFYSISLTAEALLIATGQMRLLTSITWINVALLGPAALYAGMSWDAEAVSMARAAVGTAMVPLVFVLLASRAAIPWRVLLGSLASPLIATFVMAGAVAAVAVPEAGHLLSLVINVGAGVASYVGASLILWLLRGRPDSAEKEILIAGLATARVALDRLKLARRSNKVGRAS